jgi:hypothetical protein
VTVIGKGIVVTFVPGALLLVATPCASADPPQPTASQEREAPGLAPPAPGASEPGFTLVPTHHFEWAGTDEKNVQVAFNFGLLQLALDGFNVAGEVRYRRWWFEYSHGVELTLNEWPELSMTGTERQQNLHIHMPYTTGFGVGFTLLDELWLGVEFKTHRYEVNAPGGPRSSYQTYSIGPVLGYKVFIFKGAFINAYLRYWPNIATSLPDNKIALAGTDGTVTHKAHDFEVFGNLAVGYAFDL